MKGDRGIAAIDGAKGNSGSNGQQGIKGDTGVAGVKGDVGSTGSKGDMGMKGETGTSGVNGIKGDAGVQGPKGTAGTKGTSGDKGEAGPPGPTTAVGGGSGSDGCLLAYLPSCPYWLNLDKPILAANTPNQILRVATGNMEKFFHPLYEASFKCKFYGLSSSRTMYSSKAALTSEVYPKTGKIYYQVNCTAPTWTLRSSSSGAPVQMEIVNVTLWFQDIMEVPFSGMGTSNQVQFAVGWFNTITQADGSVLIRGIGFNTIVSFLCQFSNTSSLGLMLHVNATTQLADNSSYIRCNPPHWNFTGDSRINVLTQVRIFEEDPVTKAVLREVPFVGTPKTDDLYMYYRCRDGVSNGAEVDVDCGGLCPNLCPQGAKCNVDSDCATGSCLKTLKRCRALGQSAAYPASSCQTVTYNTSGIAWVKWAGATGGSAQTYCLLDKSIDGGGWTMVWKHSYFEGPYKTRINDMRTYSSYYQPCLGVPTSTGTWCNIPNKVQTGYKEQMVSAYYNGKLIFAYKDNINSQLGKSNPGVFLKATNKVVDLCTRSNGIRPSYSTNSHATSGITFDKVSPTVYASNCNTDWSYYRTDCRWNDCYLPKSISPRLYNTQMTMIIWVR
ncbi:uncharacterized protein LOC135810149 isoform X2 [Sycon ciliatum]